MSNQEKGSILLYSAWFCPFAQRSWVALEEKQVPYKLVEVYPYDRPAELVRVNPRSLVPALEHVGVGNLGESLIINEYLDDAFPSLKALLPSSPMERARCRLFIDVVSKKIVSVFYRVLKTKGDEMEALKKQIKAGLEEVVAQLERSGGPFLFGEEFGAADIALLPFVPVRCGLLKHFRDFDPVEESGSLLLKEWCERIESRKSVVNTAPDYNKLIDHYKKAFERAAR